MRCNTEFTLLNKPSELKMYTHPSVMRPTLPLLCTTCPLKIKIYTYSSAMTLGTAFALENMPSDNQDLYVPFCYDTRNCLKFPEHAL